MKRHFRRTIIRHYIRETLTAYGPEKANKIPYVDKYWQYITVERGCTAKYAHACINHLNKFIDFLELTYNVFDFDPFNIEPYHIRRYMMYLKNDLGNKPKTRNHKVNAIRSYYAFLEGFEYIEKDDDPTQLIRRTRVPRQLPIYLKYEEAEALLTAAAAGTHPERDVAILRLMLQTGMRVGEVIRLRVKDINFEDRTLFIQGKGNQERLVPLTDNTCAAIKNYLAVREPASNQIEELFLNKIKTPLRQGTLYTFFKRLCRKAEVHKPNLSACHLRHTCMTLLLQEGADLMALKKLAGHKSVRTTQIYLSVSQKLLREAMKKHPLN